MRISSTLFAALFAAFLIASPFRDAAADISRFVFLEDGDGTIEYVYDENLNLKEMRFYDEDWNLYAIDFGNPNPDDSSSGMKGDYDMAVVLAKQNAELKGIVGDPEYDFLDTPIGRHQTGKGAGLAPVHNPNGDDSSGPSTPPRDLEPPDLNPLDGVGGVGGGSGWHDPSGGSVAGQLKKHGKKHGDQGDDDGSADPTNGDGFFGDLPGPPELVNPNPVARTARHEASLSPDRDLDSLFEPGMGLDLTLADLAGPEAIEITRDAPGASAGSAGGASLAGRR